MNKIGNEWDLLLSPEYHKEYYIKLQEFVEKEYENHVVFPPKEAVFRGLKLTDYKEVKVVIMGQDPYHENGQAHGLAFSVLPGVKKPPSLMNIFRELNADLGIPVPRDGFLESWAHEGVLLLNAVLTVREGVANSHKGKGWETFTDRIISLLNEREKPLVFILWGRDAQNKRKLITHERHLVLESSHPSPLSAHSGFIGSRPFSKANDFLLKNKEQIDWRIEK